MNDLVIEGDFVRIDEGSRLRRFVIGFGLGATELGTQVRVFQVTTEGCKPVQQFETAATGSRLPGAGFGVAVANAHPKVLEAADWVCPSAEEEGVAQVIEALLEHLRERGLDSHA